MIDLTKPIRQRHNGLAARITADDLPGEYPFCVAMDDGGGSWASDTFTRDAVERDFENVPPPQEWRWEDVRGYIGSARYASPAEAHLSCRQHAGQPVRILREGETP